LPGQPAHEQPTCSTDCPSVTSRSDAHSIALCKLVLRDLVEACQPLRDHALADKVVYGINAKHTFPNGKKKTLDLAIGTPTTIHQTERLAGVIYDVLDRSGGNKPKAAAELGISLKTAYNG
jgi:transcriptional regulator with PAS, ATPase and Fis domain